FVMEIKTFDDGLKMIRDLGMLTDREDEAERMAGAIEEKFHGMGQTNGKRAAYVIWQNPYMVAGGDTYINSMLEKAGFTNVFKNDEGRYPEVSMQDFRDAEPELIFLASEPFPFQEAHKQKFEQQIPESRTMLIDGEICWYGSRMLKAADDLNRLLAGI
ncbi:MAG TPA: helical backbone metal receptor, partial [Bacillales bacterium]